MKYGRFCFALPAMAGALFLNLTWSAPARAAKPWELLIPFRRVEADPEKDYSLGEEHGPWMILASTFAGPGAEEQARELVLELRERYNLPAFTHEQTYDFTEKLNGLGLSRYGGPKKMRYANSGKFDEIAVLVGHFESVDDPKIEKVLDKVRHATPESLSYSGQKTTTQRFIGLREIQRKLSGDTSKRKRGPMGNAFATRNPLLADTYFNPGGVDALVEEMNDDVEFCLLDNPGKYTVRVATFRGASTMNLDVIKRNGKGMASKLEEAANNAHELTVALRKQRIEAYEFHDRYESIVTIGSFDSIGSKQANGRIELAPAIHAIMQRYGAKQQGLPGQAALGLSPTTLNGIPFDVQPMPVEVPRKSVAAAYANSNRLFE